MKYTDETVNQICNLIKAGVFAKDAAEASGIVESTFYKWKEKREFSEAIKKAEAERKVGLILKIRHDSSWQSAAWMLERLYRDEYGAENVKEINERIAKLEEIIRGLVNHADKTN